MKASLNTVLGTAFADELGVTLMHEHFAANFAGWEFDPKRQPFDVEIIAQSCAELMKAPMAHGMKTLVEATPIDAGRQPLIQKRVAEITGLNIICCTGFHTETQGASGYLKLRKLFGFDILTQMYETYIQEITEGIGDTGIKAGMIKVSTGAGSISDYE
jgi:phosphotriesterase-related protein